MKFFAKQKVDAVGVTSVTLQKILLFLMILSLFTVFSGGFFSFFLCLIGFLGAYKRSTGMLGAYVTISVVLIVLCFFVALSGVFMMSSEDYTYDYSSSSAAAAAASSDSSLTADAPQRMHKLQKLFIRTFVPSAAPSAGSEASQQSSESSQHGSDAYFPGGASDSYNYESDDAFTGIIFLSVVVMVIGFLLAYLKIYSLVLAWRLRKMIFAAAISLPTTEEPQVHEFPAANTSCAVESEVSPPAPVAPFQPAPGPIFAPGFAPYPYAMPMMMPQQFQGQGQFQGQFPGQYPHHVMFGQQPVFYTYAPMTPNSEEKM